ncbi:restriction endonuclease subunit S, partial [bacterium]|nr:restriction endonuclease subunit S [bacterium]
RLGRQRSPKNHTGPNMRPYLRVANVYEDRIDTSSVLEMNFSPDEFETYRLENGDVLLNEGQSLHLVGRPAIYRGEVPGACFQNTLVRFRPCPGLRSEFALMVFRGYLHTQRFMRIARWTTNIAHLGAGRFAEIEFPLAPFPEQERIVQAVESYLTRLDAAVATLERVQTNLRRYRASVIKAAVEGQLVPTEVELARAEGRDYEPASALLERVLKERRHRWAESGKKGKYMEPVAPDVDGLPELPEGWSWTSFVAISEHRLGKMLDKQKNLGIPRPYLRNANVRWFGFDLDSVNEMRDRDEELDDVSVREGDLVVCEGGEPGRAAVCKVDPILRTRNRQFLDRGVVLRRLFEGAAGPRFLPEIAKANSGS